MDDSDRDDGYSWILGMKEADLLKVLSRHEHSAYLAYKHGGYDALVLMWEKFSGTLMYFSKKALRELQVQYIRSTYDPTGEDPDRSIPALAIRLRVTDTFVRAALATSGDASCSDPRQKQLFGEEDR